MKTSKSVTKPVVGLDPVATFMQALKHPLKAEIEAVQEIIMAAAPGIAGEIKWNSLGFRTTESFATINLRSLDQVQLIFHLGAKVRKPAPKLKISDPDGLVKWLAPDRCVVTLGAGATMRGNQKALESIVREWVRYL
jgi:hypothetical protein